MTMYIDRRPNQLENRLLYRIIIGYNKKYNGIYNMQPATTYMIPNDIFDIASVPPYVTSLCLNNYNTEIGPDVLPNTIVKLDLGDTYNHPLEYGTIPIGVKYVRFGRKFNSEISQGVIPYTATELVFDMCRYDYYLNYHNIPITVSKITYNILGYYQLSRLPIGVETLIISSNIIIPIDTIPNTVKHLTFTGSYEHELVVGMIPAGVERLEFLGSYNDVVIPGHIPNTVDYLVLGGYYNQRLAPGSIPDSVTTLIFGDHYNKVIGEHVLPKSLKKLSLGTSFRRYPHKKYLPNLTHLTLGHTQDSWLEKLINAVFQILRVKTSNHISIDCIPDTVVHLVINKGSDIVIPKDSVGLIRYIYTDAGYTQPTPSDYLRCNIHFE